MVVIYVDLLVSCPDRTFGGMAGVVEQEKTRSLRWTRNQPESNYRNLGLDR